MALAATFNSNAISICQADISDRLFPVFPTVSSSVGSVTTNGGKKSALTCHSQRKDVGFLYNTSGFRLTFQGANLNKRNNGRQMRAPRMALSEGQPDGCEINEGEEFLEAHVIDAVRMVPARNQLFMTMSNGSEVEVNHVNPASGRLLYQSSTPTIFLQMLSNRDLMLPIVVGEFAIGQLMRGVRRDPGVSQQSLPVAFGKWHVRAQGWAAELNHLVNGLIVKGLRRGDQRRRPNTYDLITKLVESMGYEIRCVRVTQRVVDTYYARIYLGKPGEEEVISVDARPSDAINVAVRSKVPIFVSKTIVLNDAVEVVRRDHVKSNGAAERPSFSLHPVLDSPCSCPDPVVDEIKLVVDMMYAAEEERYSDAASLRDELARLRSKSKKRMQQK